MTADGAVTLSPGGRVPPPGVRPGWDWTPDGGLSPRLDLLPRWVRWWYLVPLVDRYACTWMWHHGGWQVHGLATPPAAGGEDQPAPGPAPPSPALPAQALVDPPRG